PWGRDSREGCCVHVHARSGQLVSGESGSRNADIVEIDRDVDEPAHTIHAYSVTGFGRKELDGGWKGSAGGRLDPGVRVDVMYGGSFRFGARCGVVAACGKGCGEHERRNEGKGRVASMGSHV